MKLSTSSIKCIDFIKNNKIYNFQISDSKFINNIYNTLQSQKNIKYMDKCKNIVSKKINRVSNDNIFYDIVNILNIQKFNNIDEFYDWSLDNPLCNLYDALDKYKNKVAAHICKINNLGYLGNIIYSSSFFPQRLCTVIECNDINLKKYIFDDLIISIYYFNNDHHIDINKILDIFNLMKKLHGESINKVYKINFIEFNNIKVINSKKLSIENVNSAFCIPDEMVTIWRTEEYLKVLCHELIHLFELDFRNSYFDRTISDMFNLNKSIITNESFCEAFALIIHVIYVINILNLDINNFNELFELEINHSLFQSAKILEYYGNYKNIDNSTSIFSYHILKTLLIMNLDKLVSQKYNFIEVVDDSIKNNIKYIEQYRRLFKNKDDSYIWHELRMSLIEIT